MPDLQVGEHLHTAWTDDNPEHVACVEWLVAKHAAGETVTVDDVIEWSQQHGQSILTWDDERGGAMNRRTEARRYLNHFGAWLEKKFKKIIGGYYSLDGVIDEDGMEVQRTYYPGPKIGETPSLRVNMIARQAKYMAAHAGKLRFLFPLSEAERQTILVQVEKALK